MENRLRSARRCESLEINRHRNQPAERQKPHRSTSIALGLEGKYTDIKKNHNQSSEIIRTNKIIEFKQIEQIAEINQLLCGAG